MLKEGGRGGGGGGGGGGEGGCQTCPGRRAGDGFVAFAALPMEPIGRNANALPLSPLRPSLTSESSPGLNPAMDPETTRM